MTNFMSQFILQYKNSTIHVVQIKDVQIQRVNVNDFPI